MTSQTTTAGRRLSVSVLALSLVFLLARLVVAADEYPAPGYFLDGLSEQSSWNEIQAKPGIKPDFPFVDFASTYVPLSSVCVDGDMLAIADPRIDTGVRVSAAELKEQVRATENGRYVAAPGGQQLAATATPDLGTQVVMRYPVSVYKVTERGFMREWVFLFDKLWPISACPAK